MDDWRPERQTGEPADAGLIDEGDCIEKADQAFADESYERALSLYSRALQYDANLEVAWLGQLRCLVELQELQEAVIWTERALERFPRSGDILAARGLAEARLGRSEAAMGYCDAAFKEAGTCTSFMWVSRGEALLSVNPTNAQACFMKAAELARQDWAVQTAIARAYLIRRNYLQALGHLRDAVRLAPNRHTCWYWIGQCCDALGDVQEARRAYERSISAQPTYTPPHDALAELNRRGFMSKVMSGLKRCFTWRTT